MKGLSISHHISLDQDFPAAVNLYLDAIKLNPTDPTLWCNLAYARMMLEEYGYALSDASESLIEISFECKMTFDVLFRPSNRIGRQLCEGLLSVKSLVLAFFNFTS
jgi:hypothetical protein